MTHDSLSVGREKYFNVVKADLISGTEEDDCRPCDVIIV